MKKLLSILTLLVVAVTGAWAQGSTPDYESYDWNSDQVAAVLGTHGNITISSAGLGSTGNIAGHYYIPINQNLKNSDSTWKYFGISATSPIEKISILYCENGSNTTNTNIAWVAWGKNVTPNQYTLGHGATTGKTSAAKSWDNKIWEDIDLSGIDAYTVYLSRSVREFREIGGTSNLPNFGFGQTINVLGIKVWLKASAPTITSQTIADASYVIGGAATALSVTATASAGELSYQWYSNTANSTTDGAPTAIDGATNASYTPNTSVAGTTYYFCKVTDSNGSVYSNIAKITVAAAAAPAFTSVTPSATTVGKGDATTITAVVTGNPTPTIQWYSNTTATNTGGTEIDGATDLVLNLTNTTAGTFYYYAVATNASGSATSAVQTITVLAKHVWRTVSSAEKWDWSDATGADVNLSNTTTPTKDSDDDIVATDFNGSIYEYNCGFPANFDAIVMYKFQRPKNGSYYQGQTLKIKTDVSGVVTVKFANTGGKRPNRYLQVNGKIYGEGSGNGSSAAQKTVSVPVAAGTVTMTGIYEPDATKYTQEDGYQAYDNNLAGTAQYLNYYSVEFTPAANVTDAEWATTVTPDYAVDFADGVQAYIVESVGEAITLKEIDDAPANTPIIVNAASAGSYTMTPKASATSDVTGNLLEAATGTETGDGNGNYYVLGITTKGVGFGKLADGVKLAKGKAYIDGSEFVDAKDFYPFVIGDEENETTSINSIENGELRIENSDYIYNLAGQKVSKDYKGIVVVNGKKVIRK